MNFGRQFIPLKPSDFFTYHQV